jgi:hypothetical protein
MADLGVHRGVAGELLGQHGRGRALPPHPKLPLPLASPFVITACARLATRNGAERAQPVITLRTGAITVA